MTPRHLLLAAALAGTAWLSWVGEPGGSEVVGAVERTPASGQAMRRGTAPARPAAPAPSAQDVLRLRERPAPSTRLDVPPEEAQGLFATASWDPPPRPAAPPPPPSAPPVPYRFVGKKLDGGNWEVFLALGDELRIVRAGAVLDGAWRVDQVRPPTLALVYLPLQERRSLDIGSPE